MFSSYYSLLQPKQTSHSLHMVFFLDGCQLLTTFSSNPTSTDFAFKALEVTSDMIIIYLHHLDARNTRYFYFDTLDKSRGFRNTFAPQHHLLNWIIELCSMFNVFNELPKNTYINLIQHP